MTVTAGKCLGYGRTQGVSDGQGGFLWLTDTELWEERVENGECSVLILASCWDWRRWWQHVPAGNKFEQRVETKIVA